MSDPVILKVIEAAQKRVVDLALPYYGALMPLEVWRLTKAGLPITIIDVRTQAEWNFVGHIPNSIKIEWQHFPSGAQNPYFSASLKKSTPANGNVIFMCRSGARSHDAAIFAVSEGYTRVFNMLEGFEGDLDSNRRRNQVGGWRAAGLPWQQS